MICTMQVTNYNYYNNYNVYSARVHVKYYACTYYTVSDIIGRVAVIMQSCVNSHQPGIGVQLQLLEALVFSCLHRMYCIFAFCSNLLSALLLRRLRLVVDQPLLGVGIEQ